MEKSFIYISFLFLLSLEFWLWIIVCDQHEIIVSAPEVQIGTNWAHPGLCLVWALILVKPTASSFTLHFPIALECFIQFLDKVLQGFFFPCIWRHLPHTEDGNGCLDLQPFACKIFCYSNWKTHLWKPSYTWCWV